MLSACGDAAGPGLGPGPARGPGLGTAHWLKAIFIPKEGGGEGGMRGSGGGGKSGNGGSKVVSFNNDNNSNNNIATPTTPLPPPQLPPSSPIEKYVPLVVRRAPTRIHWRARTGTRASLALAPLRVNEPLREGPNGHLNASVELVLNGEGGFVCSLSVPSTPFLIHPSTSFTSNH